MGLLAVFRRNAIYLMAYIIVMIWVISFWVSLTQIYVNIGSEFIYKQVDHASVVGLVVWTQLIQCVAIIFGVCFFTPKRNSLEQILTISPAAFMWLKLTQEKSLEPELSKTPKLVVLLSYVNILFTIGWIGVTLFFLPLQEYQQSTVTQFFCESQVLLALALYSIFGMLAVIYSNPTFAALVSLFISPPLTSLECRRFLHCSADELVVVGSRYLQQCALL